ncbi:MAG TPA: hypothetical protein VFV96_01150 [Verrucomicrobiae bacterium]|nr:hypothetical protein [Verrucomicrobiae bacterium]
MAETPQHELEKLLSDYARQRRASAEVKEMHPATRRLLQAEVRQHFGAPPPPAPTRAPAWWRRLLPRLVFAAALVVVLGTAVVWNFSSRSKIAERLAFVGPSERVPQTVSTPAPSAPINAPAPRAAGREAARAERSSGMGHLKQETDSLAGEAPSANALARPLAKTAATDVATRANLLNDAAGGYYGNPPTVSSAEEPVPAVPAKSLAAAGFKEGVSTSEEPPPALAGAQMQNVAGLAQMNSTQLFRNVVLVNKVKAAAKFPVLNEFTVQQNGSSLTVVDHDGSVYRGYANLAAQTTASDRPTGDVLDKQTFTDQAALQGFTGLAPNQKVSGAQVQQAVEPQSYYFRVEGTNRSLNQRVVFTGNLLQNPAANLQQNNTVNQTFMQQSVARQNLKNGLPDGATMNNYINGQLQLGNSKTSTELNAISMKH